MWLGLILARKQRFVFSDRLDQHHMFVVGGIQVRAQFVGGLPELGVEFV